MRIKMITIYASKSGENSAPKFRNNSVQFRCTIDLTYEFWMAILGFW